MGKRIARGSEEVNDGAYLSGEVREQERNQCKT
jgi:hypothetical protein